MLDLTNHRPLKLDPFNLEEPFMMVSDTQLNDVEELLRLHGIHFATRENLVSLNGEPFLATIIFDDGADRELIQSILDSAN